MEYFHASKEPGKEECLDSTQARRFLGKLCKYQHIPAHRSANFVDYLMDRLDKNKDNQLSFEELSDQELWKDVFKVLLLLSVCNNYFSLSLGLKQIRKTSGLKNSR